MTLIKNVLTTFALIFIMLLIIAGGAYFYGRHTKEQEYENQVREVTSTVVIEELEEQYFAVTNTLFLNEEITIEIKEDSRFSNFLWGQTINAEGIVRVDIGVDMNDLTEEDVIVNHSNKTVTIFLPEPEILDASLYGDLEVEEESGILKRIFDDNENSDYNLASRELIEKAKTTVNEKPDLFESSKEDSIRLVQLVLSDLGYKVGIEE